MSLLSMFLIPAGLLAVFIVIGASVKILRQYERAVVFTLGRFQGVKGPGLVLLIPFLAGNGTRGFAHPGHRDPDTGRDLQTMCR
jgi:regulator of protease activity HflC (stomatin/prohibitin superfamily)